MVIQTSRCSKNSPSSDTVILSARLCCQDGPVCENAYGPSLNGGTNDVKDFLSDVVRSL